ncbi:MAG: STAS domain-containing protein [Burkholderiales bacterium]|nr:STAS domain-containing protein [Burkholderiales bacterium]ODU62979.1 MAG: hypothetical protein ABT05_06510 [Lautropia sp. SCN 66-9]
MQHSLRRSPAQLAIEGALCVYTAARYKADWLDAMRDGDGLELDLSRVDEIDSAGLQLLLLLRREAQAQGKPFGVGARSAAVDDLLSFCNLNDELDAGASR